VQVSGWTVLLEVGEVARPLLPYLTAVSAGGEAVHVNWSARGQAHFWHVLDGDLRSTFNVFQPDYIHGSTPHELRDLNEGLVFPLAGLDGGRQAPMLLALAERVTGIVLTPELLDQNWTTVASAPEQQPAPRQEMGQPPGQPAEEFTDPRLVALYDSWEPDRPDHAFYRNLAAALPAQTIVDIGCGTGRLAVELARQGHHVTGIDPSPAMLTPRDAATTPTSCAGSKGTPRCWAAANSTSP
jgi:hypothetical protein